MRQDSLFNLALHFGGFVAAMIIVIMFGTLLKGSVLSIKNFGIHFFFGEEWNPPMEKFGLLPFVVGTILTSILALSLSLPFAISLAVFLGIYCSRGIVSNILRYLSDLLAGIPSVVYGFWGLFFLVPIVRNLEIKLGIMPFGVGIFTASIILAIMIIPYMSSMIVELIKMVPRELVEAGYSLGATSFDVVRKIVFPYIKSGVISGIILAFGRAFGETMAVTMVIGNVNSVPKSIFSPANTMASIIANEFPEASSGLYLSSIVYIGLWLFVITFIVNLLGNLIIRKFRVGENES